LSDQITGCGSKDQKAARPPVDIHQRAQNGKQLGLVLNFVYADQFMGVLFEEKLRIIQFSQVRGKFQVQVQAVPSAPQNMPGQGGFSALPRPDNGGHRVLIQ
jgi:hypothetical protein